MTTPNRRRKITMALSDREFDAITSIAAERGLTWAGFVRDVVLTEVDRLEIEKMDTTPMGEWMQDDDTAEQINESNRNIERILDSAEEAEVTEVVTA